MTAQPAHDPAEPPPFAGHVRWDELPVAIFSFGADETCVFANRAARGLALHPECIGLRASALFAGWRSAPRLAAAPAGPNGGLATHADGRLFACEATVAPTGGLILACMEVTAHLRAAAEAASDELTGLMGRAGLRARLADVLGEAHDGLTAVHVIHLDRFKQVNDTLGHLVGDALRAKVAERLRGLAGERDGVAHLGGDRFVFVQSRPGTDKDASVLADRIADLLGRTYLLQGHVLNIGASVGFAVGPEDGADADTMLRRADLALDRAAADGRGIARRFEPAMDALMRMGRLLETDLRRALPLRQFHLAFQPQLDLRSNRIVGFEALLRWTHPQRGVVSPAAFIPLAEELGLIVPIGEWVLDAACREAAGWPLPASVAVNVSSVQFKGDKLLPIVTAALERSGLAPERLELEITEGALLAETHAVTDTLHRLRQLGVKISMDDFGTGYSSLSYLRKFPFDTIKIDQSFIRGLGDGRDCDAIVRAVAALGASLGMRIVAEGVETAAQLKRVRAARCTDVQGYFTGRPLPAPDARDLLANQASGA